MNRSLAIIFAELLSLALCLVLGTLRAINPTGPYEPFTYLSGLVFVCTELIRRYESKIFKTEGKSLTQSEKVAHREKLRKDFEEEIYKCRRENLRQDVIIRHVNRLDDYPNVDDGDKGISPWFKAALLDTYHKGIKVWLRTGSLVKNPEGYRFRNFEKDKDDDLQVYLMGDIPYDSIEAVNMDGDEYYYFPHIYCHFSFNGEPYERKYFCIKKNMGDGHPYFQEIATYDEVCRNSEGSGAKYFA